MTEHRLSLVVLLLTGICGFAWVRLADALAQPLIVDAYAGAAGPFLTSLITRPLQHPLSFYLAKWQTVLDTVLVSIVAAGSVLAVALHPRAQRWFDSRYGPPPGIELLARGRRSVAYLLAAVVSLGYGYDVLMASEH